jgi:UDP-N-acetylmuramoylalanine--D-glutamate ligase
MTNLIVGFGTTGKSIQRYLERNSESFFVYDDYQEIPVNLQFNEKNLKNIKRVIISPGIKPNHWILNEAKKLKIKITTDIEIFSETNNCKLIGVTGTNGKTTFVYCLSEILNKYGYKTTTAGNIGLSPLDLEDIDKNYDYIIIELSSFQLEYLKYLDLDMSVITNIFEDHIDWHETFQNYYLAKIKILNFVKNKSNIFIGEVDERVVIDKKLKVNRINNKKYNLENFYDEFVNLMVSLCERFDISEKQVLNYLNNSTNMEHRFEKFFEKNSTIFINDSKSTNFQSVFKATTKVTNSLLILHGLTKGIDPKTLHLSKNVKEVLVPNYMQDYLKLQNVKYTVYTEFGDLKKLINDKYKDYDYVLFSCGGSSFNEFKNYKERGEQFKQLVMETLK